MRETQHVPMNMCLQPVFSCPLPTPYPKGNKTKPSQAKPSQAKPSQAKPSQKKQIKQKKPKQNKTKIKAKQNKTKRSRKSAFLDAGGSYTEAKNVTFNRVHHHSVLSMGKRSRLACD